jgi:hypothetical protein
LITPEGKVKQDVRKLLTEFNIWFYMPVQTGYGVGGIPDFICCWKGMFIAIETKAPGRESRVTPAQRQRMTEIREHGGRVVVVSSADELRLWLGMLDSLTTVEENGDAQFQAQAGVRHEVRVDTGADQEAVATQSGAAEV